MAREILTGHAELERTLAHLADKTADRIARSALGAGVVVLKRAIKKAAPVGPTGSLKAAIGSRNEKTKHDGVHVAKAGTNVGKRSKRRKNRQSGVYETVKQKTAPHAHLVALGTKQRRRKRIGGEFASIRNPTSDQLSTGKMPSNDFVSRATTASTAAVGLAMQKAASKALDRLARKKG